MAYIRSNPKSRAALVRSIEAGGVEFAFQPGPFGPDLVDGQHCAEGPHFPQPHRWYATIVTRRGVVIDVLSGRKSLLSEQSRDRLESLSEDDYLGSAPECCSVCSGPFEHLGELGSARYARCISCGSVSSL